MSCYIVDEICSYIAETEIQKLQNRLKDSVKDYQNTGFNDFCFCYFEFFFNRSEYMHIFRHAMNLGKLHREFKREMPPAFYESRNTEPSFKNAITDLKKNVDLVRELEYIDLKSYKVLTTVLLYRLTGIKELLFKYIDKSEMMYFDTELLPLFRTDWAETFIDCGSYTGDTIAHLIKIKRNEVKKIYAFEPEYCNYKKLQSSMKHYSNIVISYNSACGEKNGQIGFSGENMGGHLTEKGENTVIMRTIDEATDGNITFIKMDIEGFEKEALKGAKETIIKNKPVLAISVYHKLEDIYQIQTDIEAMKMGYRFALRHYGNTISEYVLYCF